MRYFPLLYRLHGEERFVLWISNGNDCLVVDADGSIPSFKDPRTLGQFAETNGIALESETPVLHDLDWVVTWIVTQAGPVDCVRALSAWNLFRDVAASVPGEGIAFTKLDHQFPLVYDKLFWGNNLPAVTPKGESYVAHWSIHEIESLAAVLSAGLGVFASCVCNRP